MKRLRFLVLAPLLMAFQCESDDTVASDMLDSTGVLGKWEIQDEITNGIISDMIPRCCEFLEFETDDDNSDYKGQFTYTASQGSKNSGTFEISSNNQNILFIDDESIFEFSINDAQDIMTIDFTEDEINYTQTWLRIE
ncbi:hypothetical protein [Psychroflexus sediminis]|uniref:Lipocalin-like domain-containing protein n=1 Tax=Psychroflexus sediminis TaxID=470826 RepID=A0A1G7XE92_9FLAO|nr:hypothetical protein [Psychroflexus sediminis]SDG82433.1 hypothetical protein SAMN04488027_10851 [Psychroflexus sediminis]